MDSSFVIDLSQKFLEQSLRNLLRILWRNLQRNCRGKPWVNLKEIIWMSKIMRRNFCRNPGVLKGVTPGRFFGSNFWRFLNKIVEQLRAKTSREFFEKKKNGIKVCKDFRKNLEQCAEEFLVLSNEISGRICHKVMEMQWEKNRRSPHKNPGFTGKLPEE